MSCKAHVSVGSRQQGCKNILKVCVQGEIWLILLCKMRTRGLLTDRPFVISNLLNRRFVICAHMFYDCYYHLVDEIFILKTVQLWINAWQPFRSQLILLIPILILCVFFRSDWPLQKYSGYWCLEKSFEQPWTSSPRHSGFVTIVFQLAYLA